MKLKSLLLGSAAALVAVSGARAADAVVIPEPEAVEYVRVCDAAGTGYWYIPGTETCLKISGYVRYEMNPTTRDWRFRQIAAGTAAPARTLVINGISTEFAVGTDLAGVLSGLAEQGINIDNAAVQTQAAAFAAGLGLIATERRDNAGWNKRSDVRLNIEAWNDTELGPLYSLIRLGYDNSPRIDGDNDASGFSIDQAYFTIAGLTIGKKSSFWDWQPDAAGGGLMSGGPGEIGMIAYTAGFGGFDFTLALEEDETRDYMPDVVVDVDGSIGDFSLHAGVAYNESASAFSVKAMAGYDFGVATARLGVQYSDKTALGAEYMAPFEWVIAGDLKFDVSEKLSARVGANYGIDWFNSPIDVLTFGAGVEYTVVEGFVVDVQVNHTMYQQDAGLIGGRGLRDFTTGQIRLTRSF